jgi:hypothetical protein
MPLPSEPTVIFLGGLFVLALLAAAYVASEIVLPLVFAIVLNLLLQPTLRLLERLHLPRILAALLLILALFATIVGLGTAISGPAATWAAKLPEGIPRLQERLSFMREPINTLQRFLQQVYVSPFPTSSLARLRERVRSPAGVSRSASFVAMMQTTDLREGNDIAHGWRMYRTGLWAILVEREMRPALVIISKIRRQHSAQMTLIEDDDVVEAFPPD